MTHDNDIDITHLITQTDRRSKPRIRVRNDGECMVPFAHGGWLVLDDIQSAYQYLSAKRFAYLFKKTPAHNPQW